MADHFSTIGDRRRQGTIDALLLLRDPSATALSATTSGTGIQLDATKIDSFKVVINHSAITGVVATTAEWIIAIQAATTVGGSYTTIETQTLTATASEYEFGITGLQVAAKVPGAKWIRATATKVGAVGDLSYGAWLVQ